MFDDLDLSSIPDERTRQLIMRLLNLIEDVTADLRAAQAEIQRLRDEINRLKGEQGQPPTKPNAPPPDHSSEQERHRPTSRVKCGNLIDAILIGLTATSVVEGTPYRLPDV